MHGNCCLNTPSSWNSHAWPEIPWEKMFQIRALVHFNIINGVLGSQHSGSLQNIHCSPSVYRRQMVKDHFHGWEGSVNTKWMSYQQKLLFFQTTCLNKAQYLFTGLHHFSFSFFYNQGVSRKTTLRSKILFLLIHSGTHRRSNPTYEHSEKDCFVGGLTQLFKIYCAWKIFYF